MGARLTRSGVTLVLGLLGVGCQPAPGAEADGGSSESAGDTDAPPNQAPAAPRLASPTHESLDVAVVSELCWDPANDPDGDELGYRVWVDDVELANGETGEYGFAGTCTGPLNLLSERSYTWRVRAFERDDPSVESPDSETWSFTTGWDGDTKLLFFDDFSDDRGWTVSGDASTGAWVRGTPQQVYDVDSELAQPGACQAGDCYFTGDNPGGTHGQADVDGGAVVLTSPPFDPSSATSISVSLARFFYRSDLVPTGVSLELALLVPDPDALGGVTVHVLEKLDGGAGAKPENLWTSVAFAACGIELVPDTRLRITATDLVVPEAVVVEAAIDEVLVEGYPNTDVCAQGLGSLCDPNNPEPACGAELLCCPEGPVYDGVYRCDYPAPELGDTPPLQPGGPLTGPLGCDAPDLTVLDWDLSVYTQLIWVAPDSCSLYEGCVDGVGWRKVLRFDTKTANVGARDLVLGIPANHPDLYTFSPCHAHHHFDNYAAYYLLDGDDVIAAGHKQAFCLVDWDSWAWDFLGEEDRVYTCFNQGLTLGWSDTYGAHLDCQWIDVTDVPVGEYTLRMEVNMPPDEKAHSTLVERRYDNNVLEIPVVVD
ncbi:lysyl oxidase family protein [Enhygromyxa salina]|uniref:Lysyl oxidase n=1 Tax=Enhygromyxa salina TaxID=215803 RepID=A0A2S9YYN8_9BACT|nr:lysyl oxidase family protein [Enhygromyxa salina]PRQ10203.1 Lysyl oxidase [Enhygromyxa salina]